METNDKKCLMIGICDDEQHIHDEIDKLMQSYAEKNGIICQLFHYDSGQALLEQDSELDFLLLDIDMPQMDGIETAFKLRDRGKEYKIVMLTAREDRYRDAFKVQAFRFIPKPIEETEIFRVIDEVREHLVGMTMVEVFRDGVCYQVMQRDILYVEADRAATLIFTSKSEYRSEWSLVRWKETLDDRVFFQCHKSFLVNMGKIDRIDNNIIELTTGDKVRLSRRLRTPLLQAFMVYDTRRR
jgi:DNA-binding LytR/AlgR family response regulator